MPGTIDLVIARLIAIAYPIWDYFGASSRMVRTVASGRPNARVSVYREAPHIRLRGTRDYSSGVGSATFGDFNHHRRSECEESQGSAASS